MGKLANNAGFIHKIAILAKDYYTKATIDDLFIFAGAKRSWWKHPAESAANISERIYHVHGWIEGLKANAPDKIDKILGDVAVQITEKGNIPEEDRKHLQRLAQQPLIHNAKQLAGSSKGKSTNIVPEQQDQIKELSGPIQCRHCNKFALMEIATHYTEDGREAIEIDGRIFDIGADSTYEILVCTACNKVTIQRIQLDDVGDFYSMEILYPATLPVILPHSIFGTLADHKQYQCDLFMIMPFAEQFKSIYDDYIKPLAQTMGYVVKRGDDFFSKSAIMSDIWSAINNAKLVIAECTGRNPNVFYELGIAHTLDKPVIPITQNIEDVPFDIRQLRHIVYEDNAKGLIKLKAELESAIRKLLT